MLVYYILSIISLLLFLYNFFPVNVTQTSSSVDPPSEFLDIKFNLSVVYSSKIDKVVFIVIDALRTDFITAENMPFLVSGVNSDGCFLNMHVQPPTVTLPRIKSLTTGSVPQFTDIIFNLLSTEKSANSFLQEALKKGKKLVFYGDDTWLKLYPKVFLRSEGTSSFFVNDFTEVDLNVTRHLDQELKNKDWDMMFLHYLGLDHIGHVYGPYSRLIPLKLMEMDEVIKKIYSSTKNWKEEVLIIVTGDHGMKDSGGHGGATFSETNVPFLVCGIKCENDSVKQSDVATTVAALMGLNIPPNSIGRSITGLLNSFNIDQMLYVLMYNSVHLSHKTKLFNDILQEANKNYYEYLKFGNYAMTKAATEQYQHFLHKASENLSQSSTNYNLLLLSASILGLVLCFLQILKLLCTDQKNLCCFETNHIVFVIILFIMVTLELYTLLTSSLVVIILFSFYKLICQLRYDDNYVFQFLVFGCIAHSLSLFSSSFVEEEHQTWYFFGSTLLLINIVKNFKLWKYSLSFMLLLFGLRLLRTINQTGDKWASIPDLSDWLLSEENYIFFNLFFVIGLITSWICTYNLSKSNKFVVFLNTLAVMMTFLYKTKYTSSTALGKTLWLLILLNYLYSLLSFKGSSPVNIWVIISIILSPPCNTVLIPYCICASGLLFKTNKHIFVLIISHMWLGNILFFCQGHSNSLSSVNVAVGYVGLEEYHPFLVISQVLCYTYTFPVLIHLILVEHFRKEAVKIWTTIASLRLLVLIHICIISLIFREHLFIWSVFAPKLLIETSNSFILLIEILLYILYTFVRKRKELLTELSFIKKIY